MTLSTVTNNKMCQLNTEGISRDKCVVLAKIMNKVNKLDIIILQEKHTIYDVNLNKRGYIAGYILHT